MDNVIWVAVIASFSTLVASGIAAWTAMRVQIKRFEEAEKDRTQNESKKNNADAATAALEAAASAATLNEKLAERINEMSDRHDQAILELAGKLESQRKTSDAERTAMLGDINHLNGENASLRDELERRKLETERRNLEFQEVINELNAWRTRYDNIITRIGQLAEEVKRLEKRARSYELWAIANVDKVRSLGGEPVPFVEVNVQGVKL